MPPRTDPRMRTLLLPFFAALAFGRAAPLAARRAGRSSPASPPGSSTTNRYLHFGQSTFRPTRFGSRIGTIASQDGHWTLKLVLAAIRSLRSGVGGPMGVGGCERRDRERLCIVTAGGP